MLYTTSTIYMSTSDSGAILHNAAAPAANRDYDFDMNITDDKFINDAILNERWRATGGLNTALLDDYVDPDQVDSPTAAAAAAADPSTAAPRAAAAPSPSTLPSPEPPLTGCGASPPMASDSAEPPTAGLAPEIIIDDDLGAPIGISQAAMRSRITANTAARPAAPGAAGPQVTAFYTWRERALRTYTIRSPLQPDGQPSLIGMSHISAGEGLDECS